VELRIEDPVLQIPDLSPLGLVRGIGTRDGIGEVPLGGPGGIVVNKTLNFLDKYVDPTSGPVPNFWVEVIYQSGDTTTFGTLVMMDNQAATRFPYTFFTMGDGIYRRRDSFTTKNYNAEFRLDLDGRGGTLEGGGSSRVTDRRPAYVNTMVDPVPRI